MLEKLKLNQLIINLKIKLYFMKLYLPSNNSMKKYAIKSMKEHISGLGRNTLFFEVKDKEE